jgi:hypothetical protein
VSISCIGHNTQDEVERVVNHAKAGLSQDEVDQLREQAAIVKP